jgi:hypothetical protein
MTGNCTLDRHSKQEAGGNDQASIHEQMIKVNNISLLMDFFASPSCIKIHAFAKQR